MREYDSGRKKHQVGAHAPRDLDRVNVPAAAAVFPDRGGGNMIGG